ncbi:FAD/NAD-P-binding domain-containing protein [Trametes polyzona]|nr:FAD/NAD-P-binding domain-containing protein [Trametes polyzona]
MSGTKVIIAGCGIAGPVLAILLKLKGYSPVVYERGDGLSKDGLSLWYSMQSQCSPTTIIQANGARVLSLIPGLLDDLTYQSFDQLVFYSALAGSEGELARTDAPAALREYAGTDIGIAGIRRPHLLRTLLATAQKHGVDVVFGHQLVGVDEVEGEERVKVRFANGAEDEASFVVGCDGLHSNARACLFGKEDATFTGLTQTGGISPIPDVYKALGPSMVNIFGDGVHLIAYPINDTQISWAITQREAEARETWRDMDEERQRAFKSGSFSRLPCGGGELVRTADKIIKFGLYDRPELKAWHKGRVLLIGDAAHPTSPHLGQGANQALEDVYHLARLLVKHNPTAAPPSTALLSTVFTELEGLRISRTSMLVRKARIMGEMRVVDGAERCQERDANVRAMWEGKSRMKGNVEAVRALYADLLDHPFEVGKSEV